MRYLSNKCSQIEQYENKFINLNSVYVKISLDSPSLQSPYEA